MIRVIFAAALVSIISLCSCAKEKVKSDFQLFGEWRLLGDASKAKQIVLKPDGKAKFIGVNIEDFGRGEKGELPELGTWKLSPNGAEVEFWFAFGGGDYGEIGKLKQKEGEIEIWFSIGDPDDYAWKRFRLVKTKGN
ncbi:MAG: hypothetical protein ORN51_14210 [Akkermansiaceae bacterium]|nr:hypothetical protein [Akkermansiaceae bacterium]